MMETNHKLRFAKRKCGQRKVKAAIAKKKKLKKSDKGKDPPKKEINLWNMKRKS